MIERVTVIHKCRGCGKELTNEIYVSTPNKTMIDKLFMKGRDTYQIDTNYAEEKFLTGDSITMLHRCNPEKLCMCDFIGWKVKDAENEHTV